ncbi:hypothetical protein BGZ61DRAFT_446143 [Ilyonectria robusta]|uniref:uncharacterized protein n=1 Tax=Ilyonectria robusta TaxID=1079257 RepID=UPI001E8D96EB|nr:uncharacterized protein BGZ61DRAFT_446143 [Ilyonectria robusta]KAH8729310.1 hypothetical protein BGZ61DRAFT_446143 [Ilyonectria robusta]
MRQVRELSTTTPWCRYLEDSFQPFLTEQYACIWATIGLPPPRAATHCWGLFSAVSRAVAKLSDADSIKDVWKSVGEDAEAAEGGLIMRADAPKECLIAVFAVLCWGTMIVQPKLTWTDTTAAPRLTVHQLPADHQGLKMDLFGRPISALFQNFQTALARQQLTSTPGTGESTVLLVSTINYHSLRTIGKVSLKWVDNLSCHLSFDARTRTLSVFQFPSFCALAAMANNRGALFETLMQILFSTDDEIVKGFGCSRQLSQEVLMSYRLLFGQCRAARRLGETLLQQMEAKHGYDQLLACLCTKPRGDVAKKLPGSFWPLSCRDFNDVLQEVDSYSSRDDFPMLGSRLAVIQEFNLRQQPSKLRDLWRDRRNPLQWYTFWAVLVVGGLSIFLSSLQLVVAIITMV